MVFVLRSVVVRALKAIPVQDLAPVSEVVEHTVREFACHWDSSEETEGERSAFERDMSEVY